jgi:hypothetical protein
VAGRVIDARSYIRAVLAALCAFSDEGMGGAKLALFEKGRRRNAAGVCLFKRGKLQLRGATSRVKESHPYVMDVTGSRT